MDFNKALTEANKTIENLMKINENSINIAVEKVTQQLKQQTLAEEQVLKNSDRQTIQNYFNVNNGAGAIPKNNTNTNMKLQGKNLTKKNSVENRILTHINNGHRVMVIMRGAPGSGKTYLAKQLLKQCPPPYEEYSQNNFIYSTDDFFYARGVYQFKVELLSQAHASNQNRVKRHAQLGWSPLIIDNTNMQIWEMKVYAEIAIRNGYYVEILMPQTQWSSNANTLAMKNRHNVPKQKIEQMMNRFEKCTTQQLLKEMNTKYQIILPQMRSYPPIKQQETNINYIYNDDFNASAFELGRSGSKKTILDSNSSKKSLIDLLKEDTKMELQKEDKLLFEDINNDNNNVEIVDVDDDVDVDVDDDDDDDDDNNKKLIRHSVGCSKENKNFITLRNIYPNRDINGLWDLFVNCGGNVDWTVDILIKEDDLSNDFKRKDNSNIIFENENLLKDEFKCMCEEKLLKKYNNNLIDDKKQQQQQQDKNDIKIELQLQQPLPQRTKQQRRTKIQENITNFFLINDELSIKNKRNSKIEQQQQIQQQQQQQQQQTETIIKLEENDNENTKTISNEENIDILKLSFGEHLIKQLNEYFHDELSLSDVIPNNMHHDIDVYIPRHIAKELYIMWVESVYNVIEEQRIQTLREDEEFARLLTMPEYENYIESPENTQELLSLEVARSLQLKEHKEALEANFNLQQPIDLATHLTIMKLSDEYPDIPKTTLLEIYMSNNNNYNITVDMLNTTMGLMSRSDGSGNSTTTTTTTNKNSIIQNSSNSNSSSISCTSSASTSSTNISCKSPPLPTDEEKKQAIMDFEETRNMAAHHARMKSECYFKAKQAIQEGNFLTATYYSEVASLHMKKIDYYNHQAANCIMNVHKLTTKNPGLLDLHYLHLEEAIVCLDIFLDRHFTVLRTNLYPYKSLFIITGRGRHSTMGVSTIKSHVKSRLRERNIRWTEVNPGLLKIKIFASGSVQ